jgi:NitT/TauT family transport system ATP-binding protein
MMLQVGDIHKRYGGLVVLDGITFCVNEHDIVAVLGPSGCGKTTILRIVSGETSPEEGRVEFGPEYEQHRRGLIAIVPQRDLLFPWYTLIENTMLGAKFAGRKVDSISAKRLLQEFGLEGFEEAFPSAVSGGMRQRVAIARAVLAEPSLLLLDESLAQLDFHRKLELETFLLGWVDRERRAVIAVSHDVETALAIATRVLVLSKRPARVLLDLKIELRRSGLDTLSARASHEYGTLLLEVRNALKEDV